MMKRTAVLAAVIALASASASPALARKTVRVGVLVDGPSARMNQTLDRIKKEVLALTEGEFDVTFPADLALTGDYTHAGIKGMADRLFDTLPADLVIAFGPFASHVVARRGVFPRPTIAVTVFDAEAQGVPIKAGKSGVKNLTYITKPGHFRRSVLDFRKMVPFKKLAVFVYQEIYTAFPKIGEKVAGELKAEGIELVFVPVPEAAGGPAVKIPGGVDAACLMLTPRDDASSARALIKQLNRRKLPSLSPLGRHLVERGVLVGISARENMARRSRRVALSVQRILLGEDPAGFNVLLSDGPPAFTVNMETARAIGFRPGWDTLTEAELLGRKRSAPTVKLTVRDAVKQAVAANLSLLAGKQSVAAGVYERRKAIAKYLPSVGASFAAAFIDEDRANPLFGGYERSLMARVKATQLLFNEGALANISIQKSAQQGREQQLAELELDIMAATASTFLNVSKARTLERIRKADLAVTRKNLELARVREAIGAASKADIYRWEAKLANDKGAVIKAVSGRNQTEIALNALRRRPQEEPVEIMDAGLPGFDPSGGQSAITGHVKDPWSFRELREFMVQEGLVAAPELKQLDRAIEAQERALLSARLSNVVPTLAFSFSLDHYLATGGKDAPDLSGLPQGMSGLFGSQDDTSWTAAFSLSWDLLEGGAKIHAMLQANKELTRLRTQRQALALELERKIRAAMHQAGASFPGIALSRDAAAAADRSLKLVTEAYSRGAANITVLLDAQNAALASRLAAAVALCDFHLDLINAQRAMANRTFFLFSDEEREAWFRRLKEFSSKRGGAR